MWVLSEPSPSRCRPVLGGGVLVAPTRGPEWPSYSRLDSWTVNDHICSASMRHSQLRYLHLLGITHCHTLFELKLHILAWTFSYKVSEFSGVFAPNDIRSLTKTKWCIEGTLRDQRTQHTVVYELDWGFCLQSFWYLLHKLIKKIRSLSLAKAGTAPHGAGALCSVLWRMYWGFQIGNFFM